MLPKDWYMAGGIDYEWLINIGLFSWYEVYRLKVADLKNKRALKTWAYGCRVSHQKRGYIILFSLDELITLATQNPLCYICETPVTTMYGNGHLNNSRTIDNIANKRTLTINDVAICCQRCNRIKGNLSYDEFINFAERIASKNISNHLNMDNRLKVC